MTDARTLSAQGSPCWVSLMARDLDTAGEFYGALLGWEFKGGPTGLGPYVRATLNGAPVAGLGVAPAGFPVEWTTYFAADSTDGTAQRIRECGGTVAVGPVQAEGAGRLVIASDVSGAVFGVWEGQEHSGWQAVDVPGAPSWTELITPDLDGAAFFYGSVFGQAVERRGPDAVLMVDGSVVAGIRGATELRGGPPRWRVYFAVTDVEEAVQRAVELGGRLLVEPSDSPYGRYARLLDREGGRFSLVERGN
ncbi:VOC family protein [Peterkaempfera griseoplana]|uniref:VOC family protein n=1 Tax=Peterkaempfera griseoplana TaxID=66896 RepID=UPI0006E3221C|nr:VOC family protein [Peterkaempfera griseoplana]